VAEFRGGLTSGMQVAHSRAASSLEEIVRWDPCLHPW
jgi:hypothetical protein